MDRLVAIAVFGGLLWLAVVAAVILYYRRDLYRLWREPVLKRPVLVLESDDWGAGPLEQVAALDELAAVLRRFHDAGQRKAVLSLAVVLAVPDGPAIAAADGCYRRICLDQAPLTPVLAALERGAAEGLFSLQLHGLEHFWAPTLTTSRDPQVQAWLREPGPASTERLPPHLQSRWTDAVGLPSVSLPAAAIWEAVAEEAALYRRVFGAAPQVVVPPTFVWTTEVEQAWAAQGIGCVVTPGQRYTRCAADGANVADGACFANGDRVGPITYLVRCDYFEPARGRDAAYALRALQRASAEGRPCVLENHRVNFCAAAEVRRRSVQQLELLLAGALAQAPGLRFLSTVELLRILQHRDPEWVWRRLGERFPFFWQRLRRVGRLWKLLRLSGAALPGELLRRRCLARMQGRTHA